MAKRTIRPIKFFVGDGHKQIGLLVERSADSSRITLLVGEGIRLGGVAGTDYMLRQFLKQLQGALELCLWALLKGRDKTAQYYAEFGLLQIGLSVEQGMGNFCARVDVPIEPLIAEDSETAKRPPGLALIAMREPEPALEMMRDAVQRCLTDFMPIDLRQKRVETNGEQDAD